MASRDGVTTLLGLLIGVGHGKRALRDAFPGSFYKTPRKSGEFGIPRLDTAVPWRGSRSRSLGTFLVDMSSSPALYNIIYPLSGASILIHSLHFIYALLRLANPFAGSHKRDHLLDQRAGYRPDVRASLRTNRDRLLRAGSPRPSQRRARRLSPSPRCRSRSTSTRARKTPCCPQQGAPSRSSCRRKGCRA